jgi:general secretion pathway protein N
VANRWPWLALGVGAYLAFALALFPASAAMRWFAPSELAVAGIEGTAWSGRAASATVAGFSVANLRWRLSPWTLFAGRLRAQLEAQLSDGFVSGEVTASSRRVEVRDLRGSTSLNALRAVLPVRGINGQVSVNLARLVLEDGWPSSAVGELKLARIEVTPFVPSPGGPPLIGIGDYTVTFVEAEEGALRGQVVDNGGPLEVAGTVAIDAQRAYTLDAQIKPRPDAPEQLVAGLKIMTTEPDANGRQRLTLTGSL